MSDGYQNTRGAGARRRPAPLPRPRGPARGRQARAAPRRSPSEAPMTQRPRTAWTLVVALTAVLLGAAFSSCRAGTRNRRARGRGRAAGARPRRRRSRRGSSTCPRTGCGWSRSSGRCRSARARCMQARRIVEAQLERPAPPLVSAIPDGHAAAGDLHRRAGPGVRRPEPEASSAHPGGTLDESPHGILHRQRRDDEPARRAGGADPRGRPRGGHAGRPRRSAAPAAAGPSWVQEPAGEPPRRATPTAAPAPSARPRRSSRGTRHASPRQPSRQRPSPDPDHAALREARRRARCSSRSATRA